MPDIKEFEDELRHLINRCSIDSLTDTREWEAHPHKGLVAQHWLSLQILYA